MSNQYFFESFESSPFEFTESLAYFDIWDELPQELCFRFDRALCFEKPSFLALTPEERETPYPEVSVDVVIPRPARLRLIWNLYGDPSTEFLKDSSGKTVKLCKQWNWKSKLKDDYINLDFTSAWPHAMCWLSMQPYPNSKIRFSLTGR